MVFKQMVPMLFTNADLNGLKEFYVSLFDFKAPIDGPGYLEVRSQNASDIGVAFMKPCDETEVPQTKGVMLCFEVDDVDSEFERLKKEGVASKPPVDNPWGDRSFQVEDPAGHQLYIYKLTPPKEEYKNYYKE